MEPAIICIPPLIFILNSKGLSKDEKTTEQNNIKSNSPMQILTDNNEWVDREKLDDKKRTDIAEYLFTGIV